MSVTAPQKFRTKPVEIEAMQWPKDCDNSEAAACQRAAVHEWVWGNGGKTWVVTPGADPQDVHVVVETLEGRKMRMGPGYWVIRGVEGDFYPCKPDVFEATYNEVTTTVPLLIAGVDVGTVAITDVGAAVVGSGVTVRQAHELRTGCSVDQPCSRCVTDGAAADPPPREDDCRCYTVDGNCPEHGPR